MTEAAGLTNTRIKKILLTHKYRQLFFPSLIAAIALSLSEFVDSIVVAKLLGVRGLSIVNVCMPLMTLMAAVYILLAVGGVINYTQKRGGNDPRGAAALFTVCVYTALLSGIIFLVCGELFTRGIGNLLNPGLILGEELLSYIHVLSLSAPVLITVSTALYFLMAAGNPKLSMALNVFANVLNLLLDYVYIRVFDMGISGAAAATFTSYLAAGILLLLLYKRYDLRLIRITLNDIRCLPNVVKSGAAGALSQISFSIKFAFCNAVAASYGGKEAIVAMSLCIQMLSIISIVIAGACDTIRPFLALLRIQHDRAGTAYILKKTLLIVGVASAVFVCAIEIWPGMIAALYNVTHTTTLAVVLPAIRIVGICFLFRSVCIVFMNYTSTLGMNAYATFISLFDGFAGIVTIGFVLTRLIGLEGLWLTFPVDAILLITCIIIINVMLHGKDPDRFTGALLIEKEAPDVKTLDLAIDDKDDSISYISEMAMAFCEENGLSKNFALKAGLLAEETAVYIRNHTNSHELLNMLFQKKGDKMWLSFRSIGEPFDLSALKDEDIPENYRVLTALAPDYRYNFTIGMNNLQIKFDLSKEEEA